MEIARLMLDIEEDGLTLRLLKRNSQKNSMTTYRERKEHIFFFFLDEIYYFSADLALRSLLTSLAFPTLFCLCLAVSEGNHEFVAGSMNDWELFFQNYRLTLGALPVFCGSNY